MSVTIFVKVSFGNEVMPDSQLMELRGDPQEGSDCDSLAPTCGTNTALHGQWVDFSAEQNQTQQNVQAAVAGSGVVQAAVADSGVVAPREVFELEYFQGYTTYQPWKSFNTALKWFRDTKEPTGVDEYVFSNTDDEEISEILCGKGTEYSFNDNVKTSWNWKAMVAQMNAESMRIVVQGVDGRSRGIVSCKIKKCEVYDHKQNYADRAAGQEVDEMKFEWHFVLGRDDGSCVSLHPMWSQPKIECTYGLPGRNVSYPASGKGGRGKPGYQSYKKRHVDIELRFDTDKKPRQPPQSRTVAAPKQPPQSQTVAAPKQQPQSRSNAASSQNPQEQPRNRAGEFPSSDRVIELIRRNLEQPW